MSVVEPGAPERKQKAEQAEREAQAETDELLWLMSDKRGRRFVWRLLERAGIYRLSFVQGSFDATAFREGQRNEGLRLMSSLHQHCPERVSEMQKEARNHERRSSSK